MKKRTKNKQARNTEKVRKTQADYGKLRQSAYEFVVIQGYTQKDTADILGVSEVTMSGWATEGNWKDLRRGRQSTAATSTDNLKQIISLLSERRLTLETLITDAIAVGDKETELDLRKQALALSDEISKHNKTLLTIQKESRVTLGVYIDVMDDIFNCLRIENEKLWEQTIDFQTYLIRKKTTELG